MSPQGHGQRNERRPGPKSSFSNISASGNSRQHNGDHNGHNYGQFKDVSNVHYYTSHDGETRGAVLYHERVINDHGDYHKEHRKEQASLHRRQEDFDRRQWEDRQRERHFREQQVKRNEQNRLEQQRMRQQQENLRRRQWEEGQREARFRQQAANQQNQMRRQIQQANMQQQRLTIREQQFERREQQFEQNVMRQFARR